MLYHYGSLGPLNLYDLKLTQISFRVVLSAVYHHGDASALLIRNSMIKSVHHAKIKKCFV